ncbi:hypothetical protein KAR91_53585 [Candidatus Pacearchaeota archaeon]|nr:hypothetical protein [Candidatus Pacearchaeota archaeon]
MTILFGYETEKDVREHLLGEWEVPKEELDKYEILFALVDYPSYEGSAYLILREKATGKLYDANGSHCSCHGFEGQFKPQETDPQAFCKYDFYLDDHDKGEVLKSLKALAIELLKAPK